MRKIKAIIGILIILILILLSVIAFLLLKHDKEVISLGSTEPLDNDDLKEIAFLLLQQDKEVVGLNYKTPDEQSLIAANFATPITEDDLKKGVKCKVMMQSSISSGVNTDDQGILYGEVEVPAPPNPSFSTLDYSYFYLKLNDQGQFVRRYPGSDEDKAFQMISASHDSKDWFYVEAVSDSNSGNGRILEHFFFSAGEFRSNITFFTIGDTLRTMRGGCEVEG